MRSTRAPAAVRIRHQDCSAPLSAERGALHQPQRDKQNRCDADLLIRGQKVDQKGGNAHDYQGKNKQRFSAYAVPEMAK